MSQERAGRASRHAGAKSCRDDNALAALKAEPAAIAARRAELAAAEAEHDQRPKPFSPMMIFLTERAGR
jgi:hypothetical protein